MNNRIPPEVYNSCSEPGIPDKLRQLLERAAEGPLFDRKAELPLIHCTQAEVSSASYMLFEEIKEFIADCISLLNSAWRRGEAAYMVFGVKNDWEIVPGGILKSSTRQKNMDESTYLQYYSSPDQLQYLQRKLIEVEDFRNRYELIHENPTIFISYEYGWIEHNGQKVLLSYLMFDPRASISRFAVKQVRKGDQIWLDRTGLRPGQCWVRVGEDKHECKGHEIDAIVSWKDIPFIANDQWKIYLRNLINRINLLLEHHNLDELGFQRLTVHDTKSKQTVNLGTVLQEFVWNNSQEKVLFIIGYGGAGKSTEIQLWLREVATPLLATVEDLKNYDVPQGVIPVYAEMRHYRRSEKTPLQFISSTLRGIELDRYPNFEKIYNDPGLQFLIVIDAVDEVASDELHRSVDAISELLQTCHRPKFIVISRPDIFSKEFLSRERCLWVQPLELPQILARLDAANIQEELLQNVQELIVNDQELQRLLSTPSMLTACVESITKIRQINLGTILQAAIEKQIERDLAKLNSPAAERDYRIDLNEFATHFWDLNNAPLSSSVSLRYYNRLLQNGLLHTNNQYVTFASRYIVDYLLAKRIEQEQIFCKDAQVRLSRNPNQYKTIVRLLGNWTFLDLSNSSNVITEWLVYIDDPLFVLTVYSERQNRLVEDSWIIQDALQRIDVSSQSVSNMILHKLLLDLLTDPDLNVVRTTADVLLGNSQLSIHINQNDLQSLFFQTLEAERRTSLLDLILGLYNPPIDSWITDINAQDNRNVGIVILLLDRLDWRQDVPPTVVKLGLLGAAFPDEIQIYVLHKMIDNQLSIPIQWQSDLKTLKLHSDITIRTLVYQVLGEMYQPNTTEFMSEAISETTSKYISSSISHAEEEYDDKPE